MTRKYDFSKVVLKDIDGKIIFASTLHKTIANVIYCSSRTLDLVEVAKIINTGKTVVLEDREAQEIKALLIDIKSTISTFARVAIRDYMDEILNEKIKR